MTDDLATKFNNTNTTIASDAGILTSCFTISLETVIEVRMTNYVATITSFTAGQCYCIVQEL